MRKQSLSLFQYYKDLQIWIEKGFPKVDAFSLADGLCFNLTSYLKVHPSTCDHPDLQMIHDLLQKEISKQFIAAQMHERFPFDWGSAQRYADDYKTRWENPGRLQWVFAHSRTVQ